MQKLKKLSYLKLNHRFLFFLFNKKERNKTYHCMDNYLYTEKFIIAQSLFAYRNLLNVQLKGKLLGHRINHFVHLIFDKHQHFFYKNRYNINTYEFILLFRNNVTLVNYLYLFEHSSSYSRLSTYILKYFYTSFYYCDKYKLSIDNNQQQLLCLSVHATSAAAHIKKFINASRRTMLKQYLKKVTTQKFYFLNKRTNLFFDVRGDYFSRKRFNKSLGAANIPFKTLGDTSFFLFGCLSSNMVFLSDPKRKIFKEYKYSKIFDITRYMNLCLKLRRSFFYISVLLADRTKKKKPYTRLDNALFSVNRARGLAMQKLCDNLKRLWP